jgi:glutathione S-transferase
MQHLEGLDLLLGERPYLTGADANIGDLSVAAQLSETLRTDAGIRKQAQRYGRLMAWLERC